MSELFDVTSRDGTRLRGIRSGVGLPVVFVHGLMGTRADWIEVTRRVSDDFEVIAFDRRGRADSGDGPEYSFECEIEDVLAVIGSFGPRMHLVGHSLGAIIAVFAAARVGDRIDKLVLYEPPVGGPVVDEHSDRSVEDAELDALDAMVASGDLDGAVLACQRAVGITEIEASSAMPDGPVAAAMRDAVRTASREIRAARTVLPIPASVLERVTLSTLVLLGAEQDHPTYEGVRSLAESLPHGRLALVPGRHLANVFEPDAFADRLRGFFDGPS